MSEQEFTMYEYKELSVVSAQASFYLDCYEHFGWKPDDHFAPQNRGNLLILKLKRNRKIVNRAELTRLQRNFEADMKEIGFQDNFCHDDCNHDWNLRYSVYGWFCVCGHGSTADHLVMCAACNSGIRRLDFALFCL